MKSRVIKIKCLLVSASILFLSACGGGGSDSGGAQNDVTSCIARETRETSLGLTETTLRNICDFSVTIGRGVTSVSTIVTLAPDATDVTILVGTLIACRPPSQPFDRDDDIGTDFDCTG